MNSKGRLFFAASLFGFGWMGCLSAGPVSAAPCCSSNAVAPALLTGDERLLLGASFSREVVVGDAPENGSLLLRARNDEEVTSTLRLDAAVLLEDRWQAGAIIPLMQRSISRAGLQDDATMIGDLRLNVAYEAIPEWEYSTWKPKGFVFTQLTLPTGRSIHESRTYSAVDVAGTGFVSLSFGALLVKRWSTWDVFLLPEVRYSFEREFRSQDDSFSISPGWGAAVAIGAGWNSGAWRTGLRLHPSYAQAATTRWVNAESRSAHRLSWNTSADLSFMFDEDWTLAANYTDQTLLGPTVNSTLSRSFTLSLQRKWDR